LNKVPARSFLVRGKTSVIITVSIWCCPSMFVSLLWYTALQRHWTSDWRQQTSFVHRSYDTCNMICRHTNLQVSVSVFQWWIYFNNIISVCYLCMNVYEWNQEIMKSSKEICSALTFRYLMSCILGHAFHYSPENASYIFNQQIYFIIWYLLDHASLI
jgi:hypothetical protein